MSSDISQDPALLDPSGAGGLEKTETPSGTEPSDPQARINNLMSKWQKAQAEQKAAAEEAERLRAQTATLIAQNQEYAQQVEELKKKPAEDETVTVQLTAVQEQAKKLAEENTRLTSENVRLEFLRQNPDLLSYAEVLPRSSDPSVLANAAQTIRSARDNETARFRNQLTTPPIGGQPARRPITPMTPAEIEQYLKSAPDNATFEERLAELRDVKFGA